MFKKVISFGLVFTVVFACCIFNVFANTNSNTVNQTTSKAELRMEFENYIANGIMFSDTITDLETEFGVSLDVRPQEILPEGVIMDTAWLEDANGFLASRNQNVNIRTNSSNEPNNTQKAKASAIMYAIDRAEFSVQRTPSLDFSKEAQYMFISHYIDRDNYYWSSLDERYLFDGSTMSGETGYLSDWLTQGDRQPYEGYIQHSGISKAIQSVGHLVEPVCTFAGLTSDIEDSIEAIGTANNIVDQVINTFDLFDTTLSAKEAFDNEVVPLITNVQYQLSEDSTIKLNQLYDTFMNDEGLLSFYNDIDKETIVDTAISIVGAFIVGGPAGCANEILSTIVFSTLEFAIDTYTNFFNYVAWIGLRYSFNTRYAYRVGYYYMGD